MKLYRQPQGGAQIDWANPITNGLSDAILGGARLSVKARAATQTGTVNTTIGVSGVGSSFGNITNGSLAFPSATFSAASNTPFTLLSFYRLTATPSSACRVCGSFSSSSNGYTLAPNSTNFRALFTNGTNTTLTGSAISTNRKVDALVYNNGSGALYENGRLTAGPTAGSYVAPVPAFTIGADSGGSNSAPVEIYLTAFWNRALSDAEIKSLSDNPWSIFRAANSPIFVPVSGGSPDGNATGTLAGVTLTAATGTASGTGVVNGNASGSPAATTLTAATGTATGAATATGALAAITETPATGTATGSATATGTAPTLTLTAATGTANGTTAGNANASGSLAAVALTAATGTATGGASTSGALTTVTLTPATGSASNSANGDAFGAFMALVLQPVTGLATGTATAAGVLDTIDLVAATGYGGIPVSNIPGAMAGNRMAADTTRSARLGGSRASRIATTTR